MNALLTSTTYINESNVVDVRFPIVQMMGFDARVFTPRLNDKKSYVLEEVYAFSFPCSLFGVRFGGIEAVINDLSKIEVKHS